MRDGRPAIKAISWNEVDEICTKINRLNPSDGTISLAAIRWLNDQRISFVLLERSGKVLTTTSPAFPSDVNLRRSQALSHANGTALRIARELITRKFAGQEKIVRNKLKDSLTADFISKLRTDLAIADSSSSIRLIEAQAAQAYWSSWRTVSITYPKKDLPRVPDHWREFGARVSPLTSSPRLATNPANAVLNYLYAVLESESTLAASALGLDPGLGVLHVDSKNRPSLSLDLMESVRPLVDSYVLDWLLAQPLRREWFFEERNGNCRLMSELTVRLAETALTWRRAIAPVAEWLTQSFWKARRVSADRQNSYPTRLTQRHRSEGRGNQFAAQAILAPHRPKLCQVCGAEGVQNRYCRSCAVEVSRENMAQVALIGHSKPKTSKVKARISKTLSDHAVANSWWSPSSLPAWLTEEFYVQRIQPQLRTVKVRQISDALNVSQPYAAFIRSGRRRPHPRHWVSLAELVGVSS